MGGTGAVGVPGDLRETQAATPSTTDSETILFNCCLHCVFQSLERGSDFGVAVRGRHEARFERGWSQIDSPLERRVEKTAK
jgi:hypothetical protein